MKKKQRKKDRKERKNQIDKFKKNSLLQLLWYLKSHYKKKVNKKKMKINK